MIKETKLGDEVDIDFVANAKDFVEHHADFKQSTDEDNVDLIEEDDDDEEEDDDADYAMKGAEVPVQQSKQPSPSFPIATNFEELLHKLMKPVPDYPVVAQTHHVWEVKDWNGLKENKIRGPSFKCGGFVWNVLLFPNGNNNNQLAIYIEPHPDPEVAAIAELDDPDNWYVCAQFGLDIWNPNFPEAHISSGSYHRFNKTESDWGFSNFIDLKNLHSNAFLRHHQLPAAGNLGTSKPHAILEGNQLNITAYVKVIDDSSTGVLWHSFNNYDSKAATGFVGLNNQGATCYLNSLLQSYFTTKVFRSLVYQIPTENDVNGKSVPLALQRVFYQLSNSTEPVGTLELTKSFGWNSSDAFTQHDVQELNRILMDKLETAMKGTLIENSLNPLFVGKMKSFIKCVNVPYESSRVEDFWDIQLNVKGFQNLTQAFENYIEVEMLEGENKYQAGDEFGYQDAKKGVVFELFPPVLHLQLKRFEYDFMIDDLVKIDDKFEFPETIDLLPYLDESERVKGDNWTYKLHHVLVHQGSISNGHYYAMIKPNAKPQNNTNWLRFEDDKVWKVTASQVFHENFGANEVSTEQLLRMTKNEQNEYVMRRSTSAYMLVYYRESELPKILPVNDDEMQSVIPAHIPNNLKTECQEQLEAARLMQEALYYINVKVATSENFNEYNLFDLYPDTTSERFYEPSLFAVASNPLVVKFKKEDSFRMLYNEIGLQLGLIETSTDDIASLPYRLISLNHRNNHTNRPDIPIPNEFLDKSVIQVYHECFNKKYDEMSFFVEEKSKDLLNLSKKLDEGVGSPEKLDFDDVFLKINALVNSPSPQPFPPVFNESSHFLLFIKYFNPMSGELRGLTHVNVLKDATIKSLIEPLNKLLNFKTGTPLLLFEELSQSKLEVLQPDTTFEKDELCNGDIICVQPYDSVGPHDIKSYYKYLLHRFHVIVSPLHRNFHDEDDDLMEATKTKATEDEIIIENAQGIVHSFEFWISIQSSYEEFAAEIAKRSKTDPRYLRIYAVNHQNIKFPLKRNASILQMFGKVVNASQITRFEYEVLAIPLEEYENMKLIKVNWLTSLVHYHTFEFLVPRKSVVGEELMDQLLRKVRIADQDLGNILIWSGINHKYVDIIKFDREISSIPDSFELYAGILPAEVETLVNYDMVKRYEGQNAVDVTTTAEVDATPSKEIKEFRASELAQARDYQRRLNMITGFHFHKNSSYHHGIPFIFPVFPGEKFADTKSRLRFKMGLGIKEFDKIKFALADVNDKGRYIDQDNNDYVLYDELKKHQEQLLLALDHPDRSARRQTQSDRGISIK